MSELIGWTCIGLAAGLGGCLWPFRRGVLGIGMNIGAGMAGAVASAGVGAALGLAPRNLLLLAAMGAIALLGAIHAIWTRRRAHTSPRGQMLSRP